MIMSSSRNIVLHRKSGFHPTRKRVGFTPQFITYKKIVSIYQVLQLTYYISLTCTIVSSKFSKRFLSSKKLVYSSLFIAILLSSTYR